MLRVLLVCTENALCQRLRQAFRSHTEFEIHGGVENGADALTRAKELRPDLMVVPLFLVTQDHSMAAECEALCRGIDAVFHTDDDLASLVMNARAVCGLE